MSAEELAADNPAMTVPAAQQLPGPSESNGTGDQIRASKAGEGSTKKPTKYDVGWRRIVRNFSPS